MHWSSPMVNSYSCSQPQPATDNGVRDGRSNWLVLLSWIVPPEHLVHSINRCNLSENRTCNRSMRGNNLAYAATQGLLQYVGNMMVRKFSFVPTDAKIQLFKSYCYSIYRCTLWRHIYQYSITKLSKSYNKNIDIQTTY